MCVINFKVAGLHWRCMQVILIGGVDYYSFGSECVPIRIIAQKNHAVSTFVYVWTELSIGYQTRDAAKTDDVVLCLCSGHKDVIVHKRQFFAAACILRVGAVFPVSSVAAAARITTAVRRLVSANGRLCRRLVQQRSLCCL